MRRGLRLSAWITAGLLFLVIAVASAALVAGRSDRGRVEIARLTERLSGGHVRVAGLGGALPGTITVKQLQLADSLGVWLTAENISLRWFPWALLERRVQVADVHADRVRIERRPIVVRRDRATAEIPRIDVGALSVDVVELSPQLAGTAASLTVRGHAHLYSLQEMSADITARRTNGDGRYELKIRFDPGDANATLRVNEPAGGPLVHMLGVPGLGPLSVSARVNGPPGAARLQLQLVADPFRGHVQGTIDLGERSANLEYALDAAATSFQPGLAWDRLTLRGTSRGVITMASADGQLHVEGLHISGGTRVAKLDGTVSANAGTLGMHAVLEGVTVPGTAPQLLQRSPLTLDASMQLKPPTRPMELVATHSLFSLRAHVITAGQPRASLELRLPDLAPFAARIGQDVRGSVVLNGEVSRAGDTTRLTLDGNANIPRNEGIWADALGNSVRLHLSSALTGRALQVDQLSATGRDLSLSLNARDLLTAPRGAIQVRGTFDGAPVLVDAALQLQDRRTLNVSINHAEWKSLSVTGDMTSGANLSQARGQLRARWENLADLQGPLHTNLQGRLAASVALTPANGPANRIHALVQLDADDVRVGNFAGNVHLSAGGLSDALDVHLSAQLPNLRGESADLSSTGTLNLISRELHLATFQATYHGETMKLLQPAQLSFDPGLSTTALKLGAQDAVLELEGRVLPTLDLRASVRHVKPSLINAFLPGVLTGGSIDAYAQLGGSVAAPTGRVRLNATGMHVVGGETAGLAAIDAHAAAQLSGDTMQVDANLEAGNASRLAISGRAPIDVHGLLDLKLSGKADLALISPLLEAHGWRVAGELNVDAAIAGAVTSPEFKGTLNIGRGELHDYVHGIHLADINAQLIGSQRMLRVASFTARSAPGRVTMSGTIGVLQPGLPLDLELAAKDAQLANPLITANLDANLHVLGKARERLDVSGTIDVSRAHVNIPSGLPTNVAVLDVRRSDEPEPALVGRQNMTTFGLDISLKAPRQILVQGRGLDAEVGGTVHLGGTTEAPLVKGRFDLRRGSVSLASSELKFNSGSVTFGGTGLRGKIDPTLDFTASATVANVTATMRITGFADSPKFELTSTPELPQDEILARLLFGTTAAQLGPLQVAQTGAALATLSGGSSVLNPLARIQKTLGLDRLAVSSGAGAEIPGNTTRPGTSIEAGRYFFDRVFVGGKQSTTGNSQLEVDVNVTRHLKVQTRLGNATATAQGTTPENDPGSSIGLSYQFEY